jgi:hypothetical protein
MKRLLALVLLTAACLGQKVVSPLPAGGTHVLFIGNSITYTNDLPGTLRRIALLGGDTIRTAESSGPNFALIDHASGASNAVAAVKSQQWDWVILQQGPTPPGVCRDTLILATKAFDPLIKAQHGRTAVFQTWPLAGPIAWFDNISPSFVMSAAAVSGTLMPIGDAWRRALLEDPTLPLYSGDGLHPSATGTYLAALVIYDRITGHDVRTLPAVAVVAGGTISLPEAKIRLLQRAAHEAVATPQLPPANPAAGSPVGPC